MEHPVFMIGISIKYLIQFSDLVYELCFFWMPPFLSSLLMSTIKNEEKPLHDVHSNDATGIHLATFLGMAP